MAMQTRCTGCGVITGQINDMDLTPTHKNKTTEYKDVKHEKDCPIAHPEYELNKLFKNDQHKKEPKKTPPDAFLAEQIKNAPLFEGYTIQELSEKSDHHDNTCPTCGRPWDHEQPSKLNLYKLKKKDENQKHRDNNKR